MVDVVDLLDDSSDDETVPKRNSSVNADRAADSKAAPSSGRASSSWLREVVSNGYSTKLPVAATAAASNPMETNGKTPVVTQSKADALQKDDSDDEVLWIPTPGKKSSTNRETTKATTAAATTTNASAAKLPHGQDRGCTDPGDGNDDDVEVLVIDPPTRKASLHATSTPLSVERAPKGTASLRSVPSVTTDREARATDRRTEPLSVLDSDSDDDDTFLLQSRASGLGTQSSSPGMIEPWRMQFQHLAGSDTRKRKRMSSSAGSASITPSPSVSATDGSKNTNTRINGSRSQSESGPPSSSRERCVIHNPYAKSKTPPPNIATNITQTPSGDQSFSFSVNAEVGIHSRSPARKQRTVVNNPYSSSRKITRENSGPTSRPTDGIEVARGIYGPKLRNTTKLYPDIRPNIVLALWKFARSNLVRDSYQGKRLDQCIGRIIDLVVSAPDFPIRSMGEYGIRKRGHVSKRGCGGLSANQGALQRFESELESTKMMDARLQPILGRYVSIAEACLVAMKDTIVRRWKHKQEQSQHQRPASSQDSERSQVFPADEACQAALFSQKENYVSLEELIPRIDARLRPECPARLERQGQADHGASYYLAQSTRSAEFKQIEKLLAPIEVPKPDGSVETTSYMKRRTVGGKQHYQLTPLGFQKAVIISKRVFPASAGYYRSSNLHKVLPKFSSICLAVDFREGGAGDRYRKVLHEMCNKLDLQKIPYLVGTLKIGDYCFFSGDKLCPILVERKSVEDLAKSIDEGDGRWIRQKQRMYQGQFIFGYDTCRIAYIIEGKVERSLVSNNFVGNARHKVSRERFEKEVANLESEGFEVLRTCSVENSMFEVTRWAESVAKDVRSGNLPLKFTYDQFVQEVNKIPKETDFSRLAKYHTQERKNKGEREQVASVTVDLISDSESVGEHEGGLRPIVLDERLRRAEKRPSLNSVNSIPKMGAGARKRFRLEAQQRKEASRRFEGSVASKTVHFNKKDGEEVIDAKNEYTKWTAASLREKCVELGMKKSGSKTELIERLLDPANRPPTVYRLRQQRGLYVPAKLDTSSTAILVAIQILQDRALAGVESYAGATKDEIYVLAEEIDIKKDPFCGGTTQNGPYHYDGWSSMKYLKESGDPPLVVEKKRRFRLSTTGDVSGLKLARAMHTWCHKKGICRCIEKGYQFDPEGWK